VDGEVVRAQVRRQLAQIAFDRGEGHALGLEFLDQRETREMLLS
jgi:hypothetical protein